LKGRNPTNHAAGFSLNHCYLSLKHHHALVFDLNFFDSVHLRLIPMCHSAKEKGEAVSGPAFG